VVRLPRELAGRTFGALARSTDGLDRGVAGRLLGAVPDDARAGRKGRSKPTVAVMVGGKLKLVFSHQTKPQAISHVSRALGQAIEPEPVSIVGYAPHGEVYRRNGANP
jgi:hypothetical protein